MQKLSVRADECLYIGDGGSHELEAASALGMTALQAVWYLQEGTRSPVRRSPDSISWNSRLRFCHIYRFMPPPAAGHTASYTSHPAAAVPDASRFP